MRVKRKGELEHFVARRYGDFSRLHKRLRHELPGRVIPTLPKKNKSDASAPYLLPGLTTGDSDADSMSSASTQMTTQLLAVNGQEPSKTLAVRGECATDVRRWWLA